MSAVVIALLNQKGGVGKSSTCFHMSATLARDGWRTLMLDNDPQASLTQGFFGPEGLASFAPSATIAAAYEGDLDIDPATLVRPTGIPGVSIVPGSGSLTGWNLPPQVPWGDSQFGLDRLLREVRDQFDIVLIDCPPNLHLCSCAALIASDWIVCPLMAEDFGSQGLAPVLACIDAIKAGPNPRLALAGFLLTMFDKRLAVHATYEAMLREIYGTDVFASCIPRAKDFVEAVAHRRPVSLYKPRSAAAKAVAEVANELLHRTGLVTQPAAMPFLSESGRDVA
jgi:chromosome partitioning protein